MTAYMVPPRPLGTYQPTPPKRRPRQENDNHLRWLRTLPCLVCGTHRNVEAAHIRYAERRYGKMETGMGRKPNDMYCVPLCAEEHRTNPDAQHTANERGWWAERGIDPILVAITLWSVTGDDEAAEQIIRSSRPKNTGKASA